jgi:siroheme synthase (precorrin-2 oxidase/ferrochelatase)
MAPRLFMLTGLVPRLSSSQPTTVYDLETTLDVAQEIAETAVRRRAQRGDFQVDRRPDRAAGLVAATADARENRLIFQICHPRRQRFV